MQSQVNMDCLLQVPIYDMRCDQDSDTTCRQSHATWLHVTRATVRCTFVPHLTHVCRCVIHICSSVTWWDCLLHHTQMWLHPSAPFWPHVPVSSEPYYASCRSIHTQLVQLLGRFPALAPHNILKLLINVNVTQLSHSMVPLRLPPPHPSTVLAL